MSLFTDPLTYLFYPNPGNATYTSPKVLLLGAICIVLVLGSYAVKAWRRKQANPVTKRLSRSWGSALFWFGLTGLVMVVSRVEEIGYVSMRFLWVIWLALAVLYVVIQVRFFQAKHYEVLPKEHTEDPRAKYLPGKK